MSDKLKEEVLFYIQNLKSGEDAKIKKSCVDLKEKFKVLWLFEK